MPVTIGGRSSKPPIPIESIVKENITEILESETTEIDTAIKLCMYCMKTQVFIDGNKRASVICKSLSYRPWTRFLGHTGRTCSGIQKLVAYYEGEDLTVISEFLKKYC